MPVIRHWIVAAGEVWKAGPFDTVGEAIDDAKERAAADPGTDYVVYQAVKYCVIDPAPVAVRTVNIAT